MNYMELYSGLSDRKHNQTPRTVQTFFAPIPHRNPLPNPHPNPHRNHPLYNIIYYCNNLASIVTTLQAKFAAKVATILARL